MAGNAQSTSPLSAGLWRHLFRAEIYKIVGNRWVTCCLMWIFPLVALALGSLVLGILTLSGEARQGFVAEPPLWTDSMIGIWNIPNNPIGRLLLVGFTAVLFGGEYQWNTWKSTVPRSRRAALILIKFLAVAIFVVFVFTFTALLWTFIQWPATLIADAPYGPPLTEPILREFANDYLLQVFTAFVGTLIAAGCAAFAAMITRSILGSIIGGFVLTFLEASSLIPLSIIAFFTSQESILSLYRFTPTYNLLNIVAWVNERQAIEWIVNDVPANDPALFSLVVLTFWVVGLVAMTAAIFQTQDIVN